MRSVSSSPRTPGHRRRLSNLEMTSPLWYQDESSPVRASHSRQSSLQSPITPRTPRTPNRRLSHGAASSVRISPRSGGGGIIGGGNGLGSLADELAEAWDEDGEGEETMERSGVDSQMDGCIESTPSRSHASTSVRQGGGSMNARASPGRTTENGYTRLLGSPPKLKDLKKASQRQVPRLDKDDDVSAAMPNGISAGVEARMTEVEMLVKRGLRSSDDGHGDDKVIEQALGSLQDLGGQANVEGGTTRLVSAHMALTTHMIHQSRALHSLTHPLLSPLLFTLPTMDPSSIINDNENDLLLLLNNTIELIPHPSSEPLSSLHQLSSLTTDLIQTLSQLSDTLHMSRQTTTLAGRRLRSTRTLAADLAREAILFEEAVRWIEDGDWQARLARRECGRVCEEVVMGFEDVCRGWREELGGASTAAAAAIA